MELKNLFLFTCTVFILNSCTPHTSYNMKKGSSSIIIYDDNYISIQRSTEVLGDELFVSHLINKKADFKDEDFTILDISDSIANTKALDSFSLYESCSYKKLWFNSFNEIPLTIRNLKNCNSYQVIYYYNIRDFKNKSLVIKTNTKFSNNQLITSSQILDTLIRNTTYSLPQP